VWVSVLSECVNSISLNKLSECVNSISVNKTCVGGMFAETKNSSVGCLRKTLPKMVMLMSLLGYMIKCFVLVCKLYFS
jgi:hypothetical protein